MARRRGGGRTVDYKAWLGIAAVDRVISTGTTNTGGSIDFVSPGTILRARGYVQA